MRRRLLTLAPLVGVVVFLGLWELLVAALDPKPFILRAPSGIVGGLAEEPGFWWRQSLVTAREAALGFLIALLLALLIGAPLAASRFLERATLPVLVLVQVTPFVAYAPSIVIWIGFGWRPILFLTSIVCVPLFTFGVVGGLRSVDPSTLELFRSVDAQPLETWWRLRLPSALPSIFTSARGSVGLALIVAFLGEQFALVTDGLGVVGRKALAFNNGEQLWGAVFCMAILGTVGLIAVGGAERVLLRWHASQRDARPVPSGAVTSLPELRARIDELDRELVRVVAERLAVCEEVARIKEGTDTPVIQPARVRDVVISRRQWAIDAGIDPDFAEQLFRVLLTETHRIEVAKARPDAAPDKAAAPAGDRSGLDTVAARIDHAVVAVRGSRRGDRVLHRPARVPSSNRWPVATSPASSPWSPAGCRSCSSVRRPAPLSIATSSSTAAASSTWRSRCSTPATPVPPSKPTRRRSSPTSSSTTTAWSSSSPSPIRRAGPSSPSSLGPVTGSGSPAPTCAPCSKPWADAVSSGRR